MNSNMTHFSFLVGGFWISIFWFSPQYSYAGKEERAASLIQNVLRIHQAKEKQNRELGACMASEPTLPEHVEKELSEIGDIKDFLCSICTDEVGPGNRVVKLNCDCKHVFHLKCAQDLCRSSASPTCPTCRKVIDLREVKYKNIELRKIPASLLSAVQVGNVELVRHLIDQGVPLTGRAWPATQLLHEAVKISDPKAAEKMVDLLVSIGIPINQKNSSGKTPLSTAIENEDIESVSFLLNRGADPNEGIQELLSKRRRWDGSFALHLERDQFLIRDFISDPRFNLEPFEGQPELLKHFLQAGAKVGSDRVVAKILALGVPPENRSKDLNNALEVSIDHNHPRTAELLLSAGASLNPNPLRKAVRDGNLPMVDWLLSKGIDSAEIQSGLGSAAIFGHVEIFAKLIAAGAKPFEPGEWHKSPLVIATQHGHTSIIDYLVTRGFVDVNDQPDESSSVLHIAASNGNVAMTEKLLSLGANPNLPSASNARTPLIEAADHGNPEVIEKLVMSGADKEATIDHFYYYMGPPEGVPPRGMTPVLVAIYKGNVAAVAKLISLGCDLNKKASSGESALEIAMKSREPSSRDDLITLIRTSESSSK